MRGWSSRVILIGSSRVVLKGPQGWSSRVLQGGPQGSSRVVLQGPQGCSSRGALRGVPQGCWRSRGGRVLKGGPQMETFAGRVDLLRSPCSRVDLKGALRGTPQDLPLSKRQSQPGKHNLFPEGEVHLNLLFPEGEVLLKAVNVLPTTRGHDYRFAQVGRPQLQTHARTHTRCFLNEKGSNLHIKP